MPKRVLQIILLVSCCHLLVHVYEQSFASVEQLVALDFSVTQRSTGLLATYFRLPFGVCALAAGWLADRWGAKHMLLVYLVGCSATAVFVAASPSLSLLYPSLFAMGTFASIYHPAGLALIGQHTTPENRPMALGYHGILGSVGIAAGPFIAAALLAMDFTWQQFYFFLAIPGVMLALFLRWALPRDERASQSGTVSAPPHTATSPVAGVTPANSNPSPPADSSDSSDTSQWRNYFLLISAILLSGFVYAAVMTFLPRYLDESGLPVEAYIPKESLRNVLAGFVLLLGAVGQYTSGRLARPHTLEPWLVAVFVASAPCLLAMGFASGPLRIAAAALFALIFFMHQPLYNSLVAKYVRRNRRSLAYGLSFTLGFGGGSLGPAVAGALGESFGPNGEVITYCVLAGLIFLSAMMVLALVGSAHRTAGTR